MKNNNRFVFAAVFLLSIATSAYAAEDLSTGNFFIRACKFRIESYDGTRRLINAELAEASYCTAYIEGFTKGEYSTAVGASMLKYRKNAKEKDIYEFLRYCSPQGTTMIQTTRVVLRYLENHPQSLNEKMYLLIPQALREAWPCEGKK